MRTDTQVFYWSAGGQAGDLGQSLTGEWIEVTHGHISFDFDWSAATHAPNGTLSFQVANDPSSPHDLPGSFTPALVSPAGAAGTSAADEITTDLRFIRAVYTRTGGGAADTIIGRVARRQ
jgi:hypothetical protein